MSARSLTTVDGDRTLITCRLCRQAARVDRRGDRLSVKCFGGCREDDVLEALDVDRILSELAPPARANGNGPGRAAADQREHRVLDVAALLAAPDEPIPWRCEGIAADGYLTVLAGRGGEGKSWMALALACGVARGKPAAGIRCEQGKALIFDAENGPKLIARRLRAAAVTPDLAVQPVDAGGLHFSRDLGWMREVIEREGAGLVVFDSLRVLSSGAKESDADEMEPIVTRLKELARETGAAVVLIHHRGKSEVNDYRGSSVILDQTDMLFTLGRVPGDPEGRHRRKVTTIKCRIDEEPEPRWARIEADRARRLVTVDEASPMRAKMAAARATGSASRCSTSSPASRSRVPGSPPGSGATSRTRPSAGRSATSRPRGSPSNGPTDGRGGVVTLTTPEVTTLTTPLRMAL